METPKTWSEQMEHSTDGNLQRIVMSRIESQLDYPDYDLPNNIIELLNDIKEYVESLDY